MKLVKSRSPCSNCDFSHSSGLLSKTICHEFRIHARFYWQDILLQHQVLQTEMHCSPGNNQPLPELIVCHFCLFHCIGFCCQMYTCFSLSDLHISLLILSEKMTQTLPSLSAPFYYSISERYLQFFLVHKFLSRYYRLIYLQELP